MYTIQACLPEHPDAIALIDGLSQTLATITGDSGRSSFDPSDVSVERSIFVVARNEQGIPVGCGAYRPISSNVAELKRMYALAETAGVGAALLKFLEKKAFDDGYDELWLETRLVNLRAIRFYENHGYARIANFGKYIDRPDAACFAKSLPMRASI
ncbi:GNAT family N-acetyltransferase (plasmid) [Phyllobacterium sp. 628]|nr:GNAT family N-acetyltransferase [Phyllobacterium sp. 628]QND54700.1 GNAT family N-acetyltransferase [Phyllobacterium sp. 628]